MENASSNDEDVEHDKMISWKDEDGMEANGLRLSWGEYYVFDRDMSSGSDSSCDEEESYVSIEEAEVRRQPMNRTIRRSILAWEKTDEDYKQAMKDREQANKNNDSNDAEEKSCDPTLMGMPDILLEKILHFATKRPFEVCVLVTVCKRIRGMARVDEFWARHPSYYDTRELSFIYDSLRQIRSYQNKSNNEILAVLGDETGGATNLRTIAADLLSQIIYLGPPHCFRLRGDTVGYLAELLQDRMIRRMEEAFLFAIHGYRLEVQKDDLMISALERGHRSSYYFSGQEPLPKCNVGMKEHEIANSVLGCSCSLPSSSGTVWRWPNNDCHDVPPPEAGRQIIRRLAYRAGVRDMSNEAFILAEAELLHTMGLLLVDAYESSVEMANSASYLDVDETLVYRIPTYSVDMFKVPPPPLCSAADVDGEDGDLLKEPAYNSPWAD